MRRSPISFVLVEYVYGGRIAIITLNRPHADNAITTELAAQLIEVLETIAARASVRAIITGSGDRAFSVGGDLYSVKEMTKEQWLRQRLAFDRVLYTLRQLRRPIIAAVHGMAYGGGCEIAISTDLLCVRCCRLRSARSNDRLECRWWLAGLSTSRAPSGEGHANVDDRRTHNSTRSLPAWYGQ